MSGRLGRPAPIKPPAYHQWEAIRDEIVEIAERLLRDGPYIVHRAKHSSDRDGYPSSSRLDGGRRVGGGDPVYELVRSRVDNVEGADPVRDAARSMLGNLLAGLRLLRVADGARAAATPTNVGPAVAMTGCVNCHRYDVWSAVFRAGRCRFCYDWRRAHDLADAPETQVLDHEYRRRQRAGKATA